MSTTESMTGRLFQERVRTLMCGGMLFGSAVTMARWEVFGTIPLAWWRIGK